MTTAPQLSFDLRIPTRRPLLPLKAAMWFLDRNEDELLALIQSGQIGFAFDLRREGAARMLLAVWRGSAVKYRVDEQKSEEMAWQYSKFYPGAATGLEEVLHDILPERPALRSVEVKNLFTCNQGHLANLIADGALAVDGRRAVAARGPLSSPWITRASVAEFLTRRRSV